MNARKLSRIFGAALGVALFVALAVSPSAFAAVVMHDQTDAVFTPSNWTVYNPPVNPDPGYYGTGYQYSSNPAAEAAFTFTGTEIDYLTITYTNSGIASVWVDSEAPQLVDLYSPLPIDYQVTVFSRTGLTNGSHTLHIKPTGTRNPASTNTIVGVDAFRVYAPSDIVATAGSHGTISPAGTVSVPANGNQTFTMAASPAYSVDDVLVDGVSVGPVTSYTFTNVTEPHTIAASFASDYPTSSVPASSTWSVVLLGIGGMALVGFIGMRRRTQ